MWHFGWRQVVFITEEQRLFQDVSYLQSRAHELPEWTPVTVLLETLVYSLHCTVFSIFSSQTQAEVRMLLSSRGIRVETREFESSRGPGAVEDIFVKERDIRVFILNMYSLFASQVLCQVSTLIRVRMHKPLHLLLMYS